MKFLKLICLFIFSLQDQRFNQGPINLNSNQHNNNNNHVINPVNVNSNNMNNPSGNANYGFSYGNNYDKGQPFNGPSLPLGLMGSSNGFMNNLKPSDGLGYVWFKDDNWITGVDCQLNWLWYLKGVSKWVELENLLGNQHFLKWFINSKSWKINLTFNSKLMMLL